MNSSFRSPCRFRALFLIFLLALLAACLPVSKHAVAQFLSPNPFIQTRPVAGGQQTQQEADRERYLLLSPTPLGSAAPLQGGSPPASQPRTVQVQGGRTPAANGAQGITDTKQTGIVEKYGEWTLKCVQTPNIRCELGQRTLNPNTGGSLLWVEIARERSQTLGSLTLATPLGVDLTSGLRILIDNDEAMRIKFLGCVAIGCIAQPGLTQRFLDQLSQASLIRIAIVSADGRPTTLPMRAAGFADGYIRMAAYLRQAK